MQLSENAMEVLNYRYLERGETPEEMFRRVAQTVAKVERTNHTYWENIYYDLVASLKFIPNTPTLINAGKPFGQLSACFVLGIDDNIDSIFNALRDTAIIHKTGGGTGFDFSSLRPEGDPVDKSTGTASGPVSFMRVFNAATKEMKQGGVRRGANMAVLRVDHPDILTFIRCKNVEGDLANFNISVGITNEFMDALQNHKKSFDLRFNGKVYKTVNPTKIWKELTKSAHKNGEPGIIFLDVVNKENPLNELETIAATNPCGEQPLPRNGSCNLGHINVSKFFNRDTQSMQWDGLRRTIDTAVRFLDNIIEVNTYPLPEIAEEAKHTRRIGLGIMGLADLFLLKGYVYGSQQSMRFTRRLMETFRDSAYSASIHLGAERGNYIAATKNPDLPQRRNGTVLTVAPTGSCSIIADCSSGIEPIFAFKHRKKCIDDHIDVYHKLAKPYLENGEPLPKHFVTALEVSPEAHVKMQATIQSYVDSGISKTVNLPKSCSLSKVSKVFKLAYRKGCKSITVYRSGSRETEALSEEKTNDTNLVNPDGEKSDVRVISDGNGQDNEKHAQLEGDSETGCTEQFYETEAESPAPLFAKRPERLRGFTRKIATGRGKLYVTVNEDVSGHPIELFAKIGKSGLEDFAYTEALGRAITLALRWGVPLQVIHKHLSGISGYDTVWAHGRLIKSVPDAIAVIIEREYVDKIPEPPKTRSKTEEIHGDIRRDVGGRRPETLERIKTHDDCPECGAFLTFTEGCEKCQVCGYSKCGG